VTSELHERMELVSFNVVGGVRQDDRVQAVCGTCWRDDADSQNHIEPHVRAAWPCEITSLRAQVAELTERAEDAEACAVSLAQALEDVLPLVHTPRHDGDEAECNRPTCLLGRRLIAAVRAQYDEGQEGAP